MKRLALITGGAQGLGRAIAERLAQEGVEIIVADLLFELAQDMAEALRAAGGLAHALALDIGSASSVAAACAEIERRFGKLDILVNNAGVSGLQEGQYVPIEQTTLATWNQTLRVNLSGTLLMCQGTIPLLRRGTHSRVVNMTSRAARGRTGRAIGSYAASKAAMIGMSQVLAAELGPEGITVNCVAPSSVKSAMTLATSGGQADYFERAAEQTAVGRLAEAQDIAEAVAYLCSPEASFVTGTVIDVNGGSFMP